MIPDSPTDPDREDIARTGFWIRRLTIWFCFIAVVLGAAQAWITRFAMNNDGVQYLDNAGAWRNGGLHDALNTLWSPAYPWLIAGLFAIVRPSPFQEFPLLHLLNFFIYLFSVAAFLFFFHSVKGMIARPANVASLFLLACSAFLYCSLDFTTLAYVTPDLLVSCFVFLAAGLLLRMAAGSRSMAVYAIFGVVLGLGYLAKSPFFVFALLCLTIAAMLARNSPGALTRVALAVITFAALTVPYVWLLSSAKGRFTFGDSGKLNILWHVNRLPPNNWQGGPADSGKPIHPTRQLSTNPNVFEFATPIAATHPPWYDPSYWNEGARIAIRPAEFARAFMHETAVYGYLIHHRQLPLVFAFLTLLLFAADKRRAGAAILQFWPVLLFGAVPFILYALVHAEGRYLAPFFVLIWTALFAALLNSMPEGFNRNVVLSITAVTAILMLVEAVTALPPDEPIGPHYEVARSLESLGLQRGDPVAIVSRDLDFYWARLDGARVTMQIDFGDARCPDCRRSTAEWEKAKALLATNGVRFAVSPCVPGVVDQPGWQQLGNTGVYAYRVR